MVHEIIEQANATGFFEDIVRMALNQPRQAEPSINWIDGVAFYIGAMQPTDEIVNENLAGRIHLGSVRFIRTEFRPRVSVKLGTQEFTVRLRKADDTPALVALAKFLKDFKPA